MLSNTWDGLAAAVPDESHEPWLSMVLARNAETEYLRHYGSPRTVEEFRQWVPTTTYDELVPWIQRICSGAPDVLFAGRPIAFERTGGSSGGGKLIPYSVEGLVDFRRSVVPWLADVVKRYGICGRAYFSTSPVARRAERVQGIPVGLPDIAYLGEVAGRVVAKMSAVPFEVASFLDVDEWRAATLKYLSAARDLELISVWSPTFLLQLLEAIPDPVALWPRLRLVSCWASGVSGNLAAALAARLPQARLQPKGLLSTEAVVTLPDSTDRLVVTPYGFFEFEHAGRLHSSDELAPGATYEVVATTASGLYRYRTGDIVRFDGLSDGGRPVLEFVGRGDLVSDLVGEKLTEPFVARCLSDVPRFSMLLPRREADGYLLAVESGTPVDLARIEERLCDNPQYAYARALGQLRPLRLFEVDRLFDRYAKAQSDRGMRIGDVKPIALRSECDWAEILEQPE